MRQLKRHSFLEAILNVLIGYWVAIVGQLVIFPIYDIEVSMRTNLVIGVWFTLISIVRTYALRRMFTCWKV